MTKEVRDKMYAELFDQNLVSIACIQKGFFAPLCTKVA